MGNGLKPGVTIKGTREGLLFLLNDDRLFADLLAELQQKLLAYPPNAQIWQGPKTIIKIKVGKRQITPEEEDEVRKLFAAHKNLIIESFENDDDDENETLPPVPPSAPEIRLLAGTVRSGQVLSHTGDVLFLGDVNPGGSVICTGSIYVMGALRGVAHAGKEGDMQAVIVASLLRPNQLRIGSVLSRPPEGWNTAEDGVRFAHVVEGQIVVERTRYFDRLRPERVWWSGEE